MNHSIAPSIRGIARTHSFQSRSLLGICVFAATACGGLTTKEPTAAVAPTWSHLSTSGESLFFVQMSDSEPPSASLIFVPRRCPTLKSATLATSYEAGRDFEWASGSRVIYLTSNSRIPFHRRADLYPPEGAPRSIAASTNHKTNLLWSEGHYFHDAQVVATYVSETEDGGIQLPRIGANELARSIHLLRTRRSLSLLVLGDSISEGYNASGFVGAPPHQPAYPELVAAGLRTAFGAEVTLENRSVAGRTSAWGREIAAEVAAARTDLVIVAFGMNDAGGVTPSAFAENVQAIMTTVRATRSETDFILVAPMLGNLEWSALRPDLIPAYRDELQELAAPGVAIADVTSLWQSLLTRKSYLDLSGNGVNHPNDFGHRLYAQVILALFAEPSACSAAPVTKEPPQYTSLSPIE